MNRSWRAVCAVLALALTLSACGQKPGVHSVGGAARFASATEGNDLADGGVGSGGELAAGVSDGTTAGGTVRRTTSAGGNKPGGRLPTQTQNDPNDRVGITKTTIKIGFHAPLTGAAAIDLNDLRYGNDTYAKWLDSKGEDIFGRKTQVIFEDDQYSPSVAVAVCRKLAEQDGVFLLIGGAGTDQIQACARYAYSKRIPYISAGVTEQVVNKLPNYLAFSMTYPAQAAPLAKLIKTFDPSAHGGAGGKVLLDRCNSAACAPDPRSPSAAGGSAANSTPKVAMIYSNTEGFYDARDAFMRAMGSDTSLISITKYTISSSEASSVVTQLKSAGVDVVYVLTSPTNFGNILSPAEQQGYRPRWVGVGLTMGINLVAAPACGRQRTSFENAIFINPWFSAEHPLADQWKSAWAQYGGPNDSDRQTPQLHDIAFGLWGGSIIQHILLWAAGPDPTRSGFLRAAQKLQNATSQIIPEAKKLGVIDVYRPLTFGGTSFGSHTAHILWAQCSDGAGHYEYFHDGDHLITTSDL